MSLLVLRKFLPYIAIVVAALAIYYSGYRKGVDVTTAAYQERIVEERVRLLAANETALIAAAAREVELAQALRERDGVIRDLASEAAADPHAARPAISADGVQRIDRIN